MENQVKMENPQQTAEEYEEMKHPVKREIRPRQGGRGNMDERSRKDYVKERLEGLSGPTTNLQSREGCSTKKFTGRCRLFVGNLPPSITDEDFKKMFEQYGEIAEVFLHKQKGFGFVKLDTRQNAEAAKAGLDFTLKDGKYLRVRFATHGAALKVKNLSAWVSNELLEAAFSIFGDVERAVCIVDDRGRPVGEGIVEFSRKQAAQLALKRCTDGCFMLTSSPRPVLVEPLEQRDEEDGLPEKNFQKTNKQYLKEREIGPRLAEPGTFEFEFANRWKKLYELEQQKRDNLEKEIEEGRHALDEQMEYAIYEHEANLLRERLRHMEEQSNLIQRERELRREDEMRREEARRQQEMLLRQQQEEILRVRRRQEDNMMLQEAAMRQMQGTGGLSPSMSGDHMGNQGSVSGYGPPSGPGPNGMMQGGGMGIPPVVSADVLKFIGWNQDLQQQKKKIAKLRRRIQRTSLEERHPMEIEYKKEIALYKTKIRTTKRTAWLQFCRSSTKEDLFGVPRKIVANKYNLMQDESGYPFSQYPPPSSQASMP